MQKEIENRFEKIEDRLNVLEVDNPNLGKGKPIKCSKCKYKWITRSKFNLISCPKCGSKCKSKNENKKE